MRELKAREREFESTPGSGFSPRVRVKKQGKESKIIYPESDGKPMADNTKQFDWIVKIKENLARMFADRSDVFVAGDLLWYPVEGNNKIRTAPDAMVAFGRPGGYRGSYRTWDENNIAPQVVFEILSPGNRKGEMEKKRLFYQKYGVTEYYIYDPDRIRFSGWIRSGKKLIPVENMQGWVSPLLNIRFDLREDDLHIFDPEGKEFETLEAADRRARQADKRAEAADRRAERLAAKLRELGISPEQL